MVDVIGLCERWMAVSVVGAALFFAPVCLAEQAAVALESQLAAGAEVYSQGCATCHYDGAGNSAAPDIKGSSYLQGGPKKLITLILKGQGNVSVVNGKKFNGQMPKMDYLTDEEIAAVSAYVLATFGGERKPVSVEAVKSLRGK